ncbi:Uncharacterised protein [Mycobacteroides abscessus subsp. abscessus]|nr:Uncharacterised protein [Mycobacteroides abscessus subsp. abscessus]
MSLELLDTPMRGKGFQAQVGCVQFETARQLDGAHDGLGGQFGSHQLGLGRQERVVEADVVRDQRPPAQQRDQIGRDIGELRLALQHLRGEAVDVRGARIDTGVEQTHHAVGDGPVGTAGNLKSPGQPPPTWGCGRASAPRSA